MPDTLRVVVWNMKVGRSRAAYVAALLALVARSWPHVIVLQEAKRFRGSIPGYRRHAAPPSLREDADNNIILVRNNLPQRGWAVPVDGPGWVHEKPKPPRTFYAVKVGWVTLVSVHRCTKGKSVNKAAWQAEHDTLRTLAAQVPGAFVPVGDWNRVAGDTGWLNPGILADQIGAHVVAADEADIDYGLVRGALARIKRFRNKGGSDHHPHLLTLRRTR